MGSDRDTRYFLRSVLGAASALRLIPMPFILFASAYGLASIGTYEFDLIGAHMVFGSVALLVVGTFMTIFMGIVVITNRPRGMAVGSGLILVSDIVVVGFIVVNEDDFEFETGGHVVLGSMVFVQLLLFGWTLWAARK